MGINPPLRKCAVEARLATAATQGGGAPWTGSQRDALGDAEGQKKPRELPGVQKADAITRMRRSPLGDSVQTRPLQDTDLFGLKVQIASNQQRDPLRIGRQPILASDFHDAGVLARPLGAEVRYKPRVELNAHGTQIRARRP